MDDVPGRILLIEDNPGDARLIEEMLSDAGGRLFHLVRVERLSAGLKRLAVGDIAAVLLDLGLPDSQGFETFDRVQRQAPQVPIILLTGRDDEELAIRAVRQGGQDYLVKGQVDGRLLARTLRYGIERKRAQEALLKFKLGIERSTEAVFMTDIRGEIIYVNPAFENVYGYRQAEALGQTPRLLKSGVLGQEVYRSFWETLLNKGVVAAEIINKTKDGRLIHIEGSNNPILDEAGNIVGFLGIHRDITERKRVEEALRESEVRFRALIENSADAITLIDAKGISVYDSPAVPRILGYRPKERVGQDVFELIHADDLHKIRDLFQNLVETPGAHVSSTFRLRHKNGLWLWIEAEAANLLAEPSVKAIVVNYRDISERVQAELELQHRKEDLELINTLNELVNRGESLDKLIDTLSSETWRIFSAHACTVFLLSPDGQVLTIPRLTISPSIIEKIEQMLGQPIPPLQIPIKKGGYVQKKLKAEQGVITSDPKLIRQWIMEFAESMSIAPVLGGPIRKLVPQIHKFLNIGSTLTVPLISDNKTIGLLELASAGLYTAADLTRVRNISGQVTAAIVRKQDEEALAASEAELRALFASMQDVVLVIDREGVYRKIAPTHPNLLVAPPEELLGKTLQDVFPPEQAEAFVGVIQQALETQQTAHIEYELVVNGRPVWFATSVSPMGADSTIWVARDITARKQAEEALRENETRLRQITDNMLDVIGLTDTQGVYKYVSPSVKTVLGYEPSDILGRTMFENSHPDDLYRVMRVSMRALHASQTGRVEARYRHSDGHYVWLESTGTSVMDSNGNITGAVTSARDITARKQRERELEAIAALSAALRAAQTLDEMLPRLLDETLAVVGTDAGALWLYDPARGELREAVARGWFTQLDETPMKPGEGIGGSVFAASEARLSREFARDPLVRESSRPQIPPGWGGAGLPIRSTAEVVGVFFVAVQLPRELTPPEIHLLTTLAEIAGSAIHRARLFDETRRRVEQLAALHEVGLDLSRHLDLPALLRAIVERAARLLDAPIGGLYLLQPDGETLELAVSHNLPRDFTGARLQLGEGLCGRIAQSGEPLVVGNYSEWAGHAAVYDGLPLRAVLGAPITWQGKVIGVINVTDEVPDRFGPADVELVSLFADQAAVAIVNARLYQSAVLAAERQAILHRASQEIGASLEREQVYTAVHRAAVQLMPSEAFVIGLLDESRQEIEGVYLVDRGGRMPALRIPAHHGLSGRVIATGEVLRLDDFDPDQGIDAVHFGYPEHVRSILAAPLRTATKVIGVLSAQSYQPGVYTPDDEPILSMLANQAAVAIENARLFQTEREQRELAEALREIGSALTATLDFDTVLDRLLELVARVVPYDSANVMLVDDGRVHIARMCGYEQFGEQVAREIAALSFEVAGTDNLRWMAETRQPLVVPDTAADPGWVKGEASARVRSWAGAPLVVRDQVIAFFSLDKVEPNFYRPEHGERLAAFAVHAALALQKARLFEAERDQTRRLAAIGEVVRQATSLDLDQLLHRVVDLVQQAFDYYCVNVLLVDPPAGEIVVRASAGAAGRRPFEDYRLKIGKQGITGWVAASGQPLLVNDVEREPRYYSILEVAEARSELAVPILSAGQVIGVLDAQSNRRGAFTEADCDMLQTLAAHLAVAIANAQSFEDAARRFNDMRLLREVEVLISASLDLHTTLTAILDQVVMQLAIDAADILLLQSETGILEHAAGRGFRTEVPQHTRLWVGEGYAGRAARERRVVTIPDLRVSAGDLSRAPLLAEEAFVAYYGVPFMAKGQITGVLELFHRSPFVIEPERLEFLQALAAQAAIAIENATLFDNLQRSHQALRDAQTRLVSAARLTAVGELAAGVAHQINNPLTTVIADAQLLLKSVSPDHPGYASAAAIFQAGWRAQRVVQRLLSFARPDEGKYIPTDVNETLVEALDLLGALIGRGGADVKVQLATDLPPIPANGHQLEEVWINLLMNARDALVEGRPGVITLSSRLAAGGAAVEVEVADNGRGLGEADRLHLFTPFFTTKGQGRGNGLGLSVCRSIVQDHGGQIQFESQPGEGTAFVIRLPLKRGSA